MRSLRSAQPRSVTPAASASSPTRPAAPRARSSTPCSRGCTTCGTAARRRPTARPATARACSCRCRRGAGRARPRDGLPRVTRQRGVRSRTPAGPRASSRWSGARYRSTPTRSAPGALASMPRIEQLEPLAGGDEMRAFRARRRRGADAAAPTSPRSRSGRSPTRRSARPRSSRASTRTCATRRSRCRSGSSTSASRRTRRRRGSAPSRSGSSATTARSTRSRATSNWMRAREGNFGSEDDELLHPVIDETGSDSGDARQRARAARRGTAATSATR